VVSRKFPSTRPVKSAKSQGAEILIDGEDETKSFRRFFPEGGSEKSQPSKEEKTTGL